MARSGRFVPQLLLFLKSLKKEEQGGRRQQKRGHPQYFDGLVHLPYPCRPR
jgi:hypothetical protein